MNEIIPVKRDQFLPAQDDPEAQLQWAQRCASALIKRVHAKKNKIIINGEQFLEFGDWQTLGSFFSATVGTEWSRAIREGENIKGYEARAVVHRNGQIIASAEAECLRSEPKWNTRWNKKKQQSEPVPEFQLRSMAQTRACAKALRNAFGWVAELGGFASTPAEEMDKPEPKTVNAGKKDYPAPESIQRVANKAVEIIKDIAAEQGEISLEDQARDYARKGEQAFSRWYVNRDQAEKKRLTTIGEELRGLINDAETENFK